MLIVRAPKTLQCRLLGTVNDVVVSVTTTRGLEEAVNTILEDSDDGFEYDLTIFPPEPSVVTDEEEGSDGGQISSTLPNDIPGEIEVFIHNVYALSDSENSSEDESLAAKRARIRPNIQSTTSVPTIAQNRLVLNVPSWRKYTPSYSQTCLTSNDQLLN
ncbi:hypothetical protein ACJJTC_010450 [Scirpophaga incertulas]